MMIKVKLSFFWTSNSEGHSFHGNKGTILFWSSVNFPISVLSTKLYSAEIGWVHKKLSIFKWTVLKTLNSDFLDWEDTLTDTLCVFRSLSLTYLSFPKEAPQAYRARLWLLARLPGLARLAGWISSTLFSFFSFFLRKLPCFDVFHPYVLALKADFLSSQKPLAAS